MMLMHAFIVVAQESCLLRPENTDLNFLPFRIRSRQRCVASTRSHLTASLATAPCINYIRRRFLETYTEEQLFNFYPLIKLPQKISQYTRFPNEQRLCLTANPPSQIGLRRLTDKEALDMVLSVQLTHCSMHDDRVFPSPQMFTIQQLDSPRLSKLSANLASTANWKPLTLISITWQWINPHTRNTLTYCVTAPPGNSTTTLSLRRCLDNLGDGNNLGAQVKILQSFVLERTVVSGPPIRQGIKIGKQPSWSDKY
jgi:hypothetical protein